MRSEVLFNNLLNQIPGMKKFVSDPKGKSLIEHILSANEFYSTKESLVDIAINGLGKTKKGMNVRNIEDYIDGVAGEIVSVRSKEKITNTIKTITRNLKKRRKDSSFENILRYSELYCMYGFYPKRVALVILDIKKEFYQS